MNTLNLKIIVGSTREGRFSSTAAKWIADIALKKGIFNVEIVDLIDYPMPFFDSAMSPSFKTSPYPDAMVEKFTSKIAEGDAYILITPEYNHSTSGVLKNALDWVYKEWNNKAVGFVSYGSVGGSRAVEHLRGITAELQMASVREAVHFLGNEYFKAAFGDQNFEPMFAGQKDKAEAMLGQLQWWGNALKVARENN
jgi:NAD(P)H-dependent FMN reductase